MFLNRKYTAMELQEKTERLASVLAYERWEKKVSRNPRSRFIPLFPYDKERDFERNKHEMVSEIRSNRKLELIDTHLFPMYEEYEKRVRDYLFEICQNYSGAIHSLRHPILKSHDYPNGGNYYDFIGTITQRLFLDVDDRFFNDLSIGINFIVPSVGYNDFFWPNTVFDYDRKATLQSFDGKKLGKITGSITMVVTSANRSKDAFVETVPIVMGMLCMAWNDLQTVISTKGYRWCSTRPGKGRYFNNTNELLCKNDNEGLASLGNLLKMIWTLDQEVDRYQEFSAKGFCALPSPGDSPEELVSNISDIIEKSHAFGKLEELESLFSFTAMRLMENSSEHAICELWNRCSKSKAKSMNELITLIRSKIDDLEGRALQVFAIRLMYESFRHQNRWEIF